MRHAAASAQGAVTTHVVRSSACAWADAAADPLPYPATGLSLEVRADVLFMPMLKILFKTTKNP